MCVFIVCIIYQRKKILSFDSISARIYTLFCFNIWRHSPCFDALLEIQRGGSLWLMI